MKGSTNSTTQIFEEISGTIAGNQSITGGWSDLVLTLGTNSQSSSGYYTVTSNKYIKVPKAGRYFINTSICCRDSANKTIMLFMMINNGSVAASRIQGTAYDNSCNVTKIVTLNANDTVSFIMSGSDTSPFTSGSDDENYYQIVHLG